MSLSPPSLTEWCIMYATKCATRTGLRGFGSPTTTGPYACVEAAGNLFRVWFDPLIPWLMKQVAMFPTLLFAMGEPHGVIKLKKSPLVFIYIRRGYPDAQYLFLPSSNNVTNMMDEKKPLAELEGVGSLPDFSHVDEKKILRKMDLRLIPIMSLLYLLAFLDRGNIGNARIEGLEADLRLTGSQYNWCCKFTPSVRLCVRV